MELKNELNIPFSERTYCHEKTLTDSLARKGNVIKMKNMDWNNFEVYSISRYEIKNEIAVAHKQTIKARLAILSISLSLNGDKSSANPESENEYLLGVASFKKKANHAMIIIGTETVTTIDTNDFLPKNL